MLKKTTTTLVCVCLSFAFSAPAAGQTVQADEGGQASLASQLPQRPTSAQLFAPAKAEMPAFADLFKPLGGDFRRMASRNHLALLAVGVAGAWTAHPFDSGVATGPWTREPNATLSPGKTVGDFATQTAAAVATYVIGRSTDNAKVAKVGAELFRAQIVSQATAQAIKISVRRVRPDGTSLSFPSGHTSSAFATATVLQSNFGWKVGIPAYAMASWVATSRMQAKRHYLSDVIGGAAVGILAGRSVTIGSGKARFAMSPMAAEGGVGVSFVRVN